MVNKCKADYNYSIVKRTRQNLKGYNKSSFYCNTGYNKKRVSDTSDYFF